MNKTPIQILIVDDIAANRSLLGHTLEPAGYDVLLVPSGEAALEVARRAQPSLILLDIVMPGLTGFETCQRLKQQEETKDIPVIFITSKDDTESILQGFHLGGVDYITRPFQEEVVRARVENQLRIHRLTQQLLQKNRQLLEEIAKRVQAEGDLARADERLALLSDQEAQHWGIEGFISQSATISAILRDVHQLHYADKVSVLIIGESGTGKELIARAIHFGGSRSHQPFIALNCSTIPRELAESTLFGHVRGAFTGATGARQGYFELAEGGTLFLDEIGDMPYELQAKLLRVLEDRRYIPVGGAHERIAEVRVISATNQDLHTRIDRGLFRQDLYFRLAEYTVEVPPLRDRPEDIPLLVEHFLRLFAEEMGRERPRVSPEAMAALQQYSFPGNVRELKNIVEHAMIKSGGGGIQPHHLYLLNDISKENHLYSDLNSGNHLGAMNDFEQRKELVVKRSLSSNAHDPSTGRPDPSDPLTDEEKILAYVETHGTINNSECRQLLVSDLHHASYLLKKLHDYGLLQSDGERRWKRYRRA
ncbi:MAG: sigma-54-dependent transcriptional regulator [bacterium]